MKKEYKKSYLGFIIWMIAFFVLCIGMPIIIDNLIGLSTVGATRVIDTFMIVSIDILLLMMYKTESVYWITGGPTFEEAKKAGSEVRKRYAWRHLKPFLWGSVISFIYTGISIAADLPFGYEIAVCCLAVCGGAISTIGVKFE